MIPKVNPSAVVQLVITAVVVYLAVLLPQIADIVGDGYQSSDLHDTGIAAYTGLAVVLRAVALFLPARKQA